MTALLHQPTHATAELHWLAEQVRIETDQRNFGGSWRSLRAARSDRHDLADREGPTRTMADQGGVTEDSRRNGPHCGDLPTVVGAIWRTNVRTPAQHYRHPDPCMCDCSLKKPGGRIKLAFQEISKGMLRHKQQWTFNHIQPLLTT